MLTLSNNEYFEIINPQLLSYWSVNMERVISGSVFSKN